jgi:hypothetical protein
MQYGNGVIFKERVQKMRLFIVLQKGYKVQGIRENISTPGCKGFPRKCRQPHGIAATFTVYTPGTILRHPGKEICRKGITEKRGRISAPSPGVSLHGQTRHRKRNENHRSGQVSVN